MQMIGALCIALLLETASTGFVRAAQVEESTGLPVLTTLPHTDEDTPRSTLDRLIQDPYSLFAERLRHLRETLLLTNDSDSAHSFVVVSALPGEGKTTTAAGLARMCALSGKSTLLIDLDTRRSCVFRLDVIEMVYDLADVLAQRAGLNDAIQSAPNLGFDLLCSAGHTEVLADGLQKTDLRSLIETLKSTYDVVIIDAPPVLAVSDALLVASVADSVVFTLRWRSTPKQAVSAALMQLGSIGVRPTGIVVNAIALDRDPDHLLKGYGYGD